MKNYIISCSSTADLSKKHFEDRDIKYICFHFELDGKPYYDDLGETISFEDFYKAMENGAMTRTSQINADEFEKHFESFLSQGKDLIHVSLSSGISGTVNSAMIAKNNLEEKYPERKIYVVDSLGASSGYGLLVDKMADLRDEGMEIEELYNWTNDNRLRVHHWFFSTDLKYYVRGGRISKTAGFVGGALRICPLLNVDNEGKLIPRMKIRTKKRAIEAIVEQMALNAQDFLFYSDKCYISHSACIDDAKAVAAIISKLFPKVKEVLINDIGTTIGSHTGPGTVALFFWGNKRE